MLSRKELANKSALWKNDVPTDAKEFYFIPRIYLMREFINVSNHTDVVDVDLSITPLYIADGQEVTMRIDNGHLQIRVTKKNV